VFTISATGLYQPVILVDIFTPCFASLIWLPGLRGYPHAIVRVHLVFELSHSQNFRDCQISVIMIELGWRVASQRGLNGG
jgi:hypothetical protein